MALCLPESFKIVEGIANLADGEARTSDTVCLKNAQNCWIVCTILGGAATAMDINPYECTDIAAVTEQAIATAQDWWLNSATATTDTLVKQTAATSMDTSAAANNQMVVIRIDPALLTAGYDCIRVKTEGDAAANLISVVFLLETRYGGATPPSAIID